jgi:dinuclear metal center YbgI/SA1388 family protein
MNLSDLLPLLDHIAPTRYAEPWDNVGLLAGDPAQQVTRALLTIDYTPDVAAEAQQQSCDLILAYHPPIFDALKRLTAGSPVFDAIRRGVAIYSPHTALDVADGGTNDMLADILGLPADARQPLRLTQSKSAANCKLVTFAPEAAAEQVASALFDAGAGRIGNYACCSFRSPGTGTFYGAQGSTNPAVGQSGRLERAPELRIETILPIERVTAAVQALRKSHPYEEPAFDLVQLATPPEGKGQGRIGDLPAPTDRAAIIERVKRELALRHLLVAGPTSGPARRLACCAGACGDLLADALAQNADLYLTGEMRHHDALKAAQCGLTVLCTLHSNSERKVLERYARRISQSAPGLHLSLSARDRDPFTVL